MIYDCCFVRNFNPEFFVLTLDWDQIQNKILCYKMLRSCEVDDLWLLFCQKL